MAVVFSTAALLIPSAAPTAPPGDYQGPKVPWPKGAGGTDKSGKGAVLCSWMFMDGALQVAEECRPGQDPEFQAALRASVAKMDAFVMANSADPMTVERMAAIREEQRRQNRFYADRRGGLCRSDAAQMYDMMKRTPPDKLISGTEDMLSVPREPVVNPCV